MPGYILYVGGFGPKKDPETLIRARGLLPLDAPPLVLAGPLAHGAHRLIRYAAQLGLSEHVRFLDTVPDDDLVSLYHGASCFAFPALAEGFGLPPLEAMAAGLPVVVAHAASLPELVGDGACLFPPRDDRALAGVLSRFLTSPAAAQYWAREATKRASSFTWDTAASRTEHVLQIAAATPIFSLYASRLSELRHWKLRCIRTRHPATPPRGSRA